jgi:hypothetical protein
MGRNSYGAGGGGIKTLRRIAKFHGYTVSRLSEAQSSGGRYKYAIRGGPTGRSNMRAESQGMARRLLMREVRDVAVRRYIAGQTPNVSTRRVRPSVARRRSS